MYKEDIDKTIASALKNGEQVKLDVWRAIKNEFIKFEKSGTSEILNDEKEIKIINKMVQQKREAIDIFANAKRDDIVQMETKELEILLELIPKEPTEEDIDALIKNISENRSEKLTIKDLKEVMNLVKTKFPTVNGGIVSKIFREKYI